MKYAILFVLLCMFAKSDEIFQPITKYFYNANIQSIVIKKRCNGNHLTKSDIEKFLRLSTKFPLVYMHDYSNANCYVEGVAKIDSKIYEFRIDKLGLGFVGYDNSINICDAKDCKPCALPDEYYYRLEDGDTKWLTNCQKEHCVNE